MSTDNLDLLEREYQIRIEAAAEPERKAQLEQERDRKVATYWKDQSQRQQMDAFRQKVLAEYPEADPAAITGGTEEEIKASAKASHERIVDRLAAREQAAREAVQKELQQQQARQAYGQGGGGPAGGGAMPSPEGAPPGSAGDFMQQRVEGIQKLEQGTITKWDTDPENPRSHSRQVFGRVVGRHIEQGIRGEIPSGPAAEQK